jgi:hypothetical protein
VDVVVVEGRKRGFGSAKEGGGGLKKRLKERGRNGPFYAKDAPKG